MLEEEEEEFLPVANGKFFTFFVSFKLACVSNCGELYDTYWILFVGFSTLVDHAIVSCSHAIVSKRYLSMANKLTFQFSTMYILS